MKILCFIDSLGSGGAQNQMVNLVLGLSKLGYKIDLVTFYNIDFFEKRLKHDSNIKRINIEKKNKLGINVIIGLIKLLNYNNYEFAISYLNTPNFYLSIAKLFCKNKNTVFITSERNTTNFKFSKLLIQKKASHFIADYLICNSYHEANAWKLNWPIIKNKVSTIYNGIDLERFSFVQAKPANKYKMLCIASVIPRKNAEYIIEALNILKAKHDITIEFTWIGQRLKNDFGMEYFEKLTNLLNRYNLDTSWVWGSPQKNIEDILVHYDALVLASKQEGVPNVICESMARGLPVFASDTLDNPFLLGNSERGFLFDITNPDSLADLIMRFYKLDEMEIKKMRVSQRDFAESNLSISIMIQEYNKFFIKHKK